MATESLGHGSNVSVFGRQAGCVEFYESVVYGLVGISKSVSSFFGTVPLPFHSRYLAVPRS